ncbi:MAG TPA: DUF63 family protein [Candidatus Thermoplasmatota archaeon]|nr:DUF63 family protein [Candidatus Thermoplasmatota archaeon]
MDDPPAAPSEERPEAPPLRAAIERHALWAALGALAIAGALVFVGVQVAPETFYDHFWWEDIYGPLVVDAHQCRTAAQCPGLGGPPGVVVKDGYTVTSELTYGAVLAVLLYGIYVGLFRRFGIVADGWFVLGLLPWILLGPLGRALEDANVFCQAGTDCTPGPFAYVFISPVIYIFIALFVIGALLVGVWVRERAHERPAKLTAIVGALLALGLTMFAVLASQRGAWFSALPPLWFLALACAGALALFHVRAREGLASVNLTTFVLGVPFAAGCIWLIARWLTGDVWSRAAWNGRFFLLAGAFVLAMAALVAALVYAGARWLGRSRLADRWAAAGARVPESTERALGKWGAIALGIGLLLAGILPNLAPLVQQVPYREGLIPALMLGGLAALVAFAFVHLGRERSRVPGALLVFALGINVALVFAHMVDGLATWVALADPVGFGIPQYSEKHPFSEFLLRYWNGFLFPFTKLLMVLVVAWMLDREARTPQGESFDSRNMVGLVKMAIFVLGFAPGLRDVLRLTMGV